MDEIKVLHIPCNVPYIQKLHKPGYIQITNSSATPNFAWLKTQMKDSIFRSTFQVCHIHFGFEFEPIEVVRETLDALNKHNKPIIFTIHELSSVHGVDDTTYQQYVRLINEYASSFITLTDSAKKNFLSTYKGDHLVSVLPHGRVVNSQVKSIKKGSRKSVILCGSLRINRDVLTTFINLALSHNDKWKLEWITKPFTGAQLLNTQLQLALGFTSRKSVSIQTTMPLSDFEMYQTVASADVLVLPYLDAGHSGQLELAFDCGTQVIATDVGFLRDQVKFWPDDLCENVTFVNWSDGRTWLYQERLVVAVKNAINTPNKNRLMHKRFRFREQEHANLLRVHYEIYWRALKLT